MAVIAAQDTPGVLDQLSTAAGLFSVAMVGLVRTYRTAERFAQIGAVLIKHGFGEVVSRLRLGGTPPVAEDGSRPADPLAIRLRRVLEDLGPRFVKLGQIASTRPDVLPASLISDDREHECRAEDSRSNSKEKMGTDV